MNNLSFKHTDWSGILKEILSISNLVWGIGMLYSKYIETNQWGYKDITIKFVSVLLETLFASILIWNVLWEKNKDLVHTIFGMTSVCIGIATFLIIWNKRGEENNINDVLGFGFFIVSIFDFMHAYYYEGLIVNDILKSQL